MANDISIRGIFGRLSGRVLNFLRSYGQRDQEFRLQPKGQYAPDSLFAAHGFNEMGEQLRNESDLLSRYVDYEDMDDYTETANALDVFADEATQPDAETGKTLEIEADVGDIKDKLRFLFEKRLRIDEEIWPMTRSLCKYGNLYQELIVTDDGVMGLYNLPAPSVRRIEKDKGVLLGFIQSLTGTGLSINPQEFEKMLADPNRQQSATDAVFEDWQVAHMRFQSKHLHSKYGYGVLEPARWVWKRLLLLEDSALIYRLSRAPSRFVFTVDVGQIPRNEVFGALNKYKDMLKKRRLVDPMTGKLSMRFNPLCLSGDTKVVLLDGREVSVRDMAAEHEAGKRNWVYSVDEKTARVVPGEVLWAGPTRLNAEMVEVMLDNGKSVRCTPDHKFLMRDGAYVEAQELKGGDSLMPLYRKEWRRGRRGRYELVFHPGPRKWETTHRVVGQSTWGDAIYERGKVIHHVDCYGRNNLPANLMLMSESDHQRWHAAHGAPLIAHSRSEAKRRQTSALNRLRDSGQYIRAYNASPKHAADNAVRSVGKIAMWADPARRTRARERMTIKFDDWCVSFVTDLVRRAPRLSIEKAAAFLSECDGFMGHLREINSRPIKARLNRHQLRTCLERVGFVDWDAFKSVALRSGAPTVDAPSVENHRVVEVRFLSEREDTYTLTISPVHNFALGAGVVVRNSFDEDFFLPKANGERLAEVETLEGPTYPVMDDVEYFRSKLFAAIKIPKAYMGYDEASTKSTMAMIDVNFARVIMRIQREVRNGLKRIGNVHLVALGIDPAAVDWDVVLTVPSAIFELAQLEVRNARAEFAEKMEKYVSMYWIMRNIFGYSDEEIEAIQKQRAKEAAGAEAESAEGENKRKEVEDPRRRPDTLRVPARSLFSGGFGRRVEPGAIFGANRPRRDLRPLTEEMLFKGGNRDHEKFVEDNFKKLMQRNRTTETRLTEVRGMMRELALSLRSSRKR